MKILRQMLMNDNDYCNHPDYAKSSSNSLRVLGWLAVSLGFVEIAVGTMIYGQRWFGSISDGASFYGTAYILPFVLGGMAVYFWGYHGYAPVDRLCAKVMSVAAFFTAMFQSKTDDNIYLEKIGLLGVSPRLSNIIHSAAAVVLFLTLTLWVGFLFTCSRGAVTGEKKVFRKKTLFL